MAQNFPDAPSSGQIFQGWKYDGAKWIAAVASGDITGVAAGTGLTGGGTSGDVSLALSVPVSIANGGTGATTAPQALTNLGAAPLAAPAFTGAPTAATAAPGTNTTQLASTAFVQAAVATAGGAFVPLDGSVPMTGGLSVKLNAAAMPAAPAGSMVRGYGADNTDALVVVDAFGTGVPRQLTRRAKGTAAAPTAPLANDILASTESQAWLGGSYGYGTGIYSVAAENWSGTTKGSYLQFNTFAPGASGGIEAPVRIGRGLTVGGGLPDPGPGCIAMVAASPALSMDTQTGGSATLIGTKNGLGFRRWDLVLGYGGNPESSGNAGSDLLIGRYNDAGAYIVSAIQIFRSTGACYNGTGTWNSLSDANLKTDIADYTSGLAEIRQLRPVSFGWKNKEFGAAKNWGLVAQEVEAIMPELVGEVDIAAPGSDETNIVKTVDPGRAIYALINAVKELAAQVSELQAKVA